MCVWRNSGKGLFLKVRVTSAQIYDMPRRGYTPRKNKCYFYVVPPFIPTVLLWTVMEVALQVRNKLLTFSLNRLSTSSSILNFPECIYNTSCLAEQKSKKKKTKTKQKKNNVFISPKMPKKAQWYPSYYLKLHVLSGFYFSNLQRVAIWKVIIQTRPLLDRILNLNPQDLHYKIFHSFTARSYQM